MKDHLDEYLGDFILESRELLEKATESILLIEKEPDNLNEMNSLFRTLHTIKGSAGFFKLDTISKQSHKIENLLDKLRNQTLSVNQEIVDILFAGLDCIGSMFDLCEQGQPLTEDVSLNERIDRILNKEQSAPVHEKKVGEILIAQGIVSEDQVEEALAVQGKKVGDILIAQGTVNEEQVAAALSAQKSGAPVTPVAKIKQAATMRVSEEKIITMGNLAGELLVASNTYEYIQDSITSGKIDPLTAEKMMAENLHLFSRLVNEVHNNVMAMSMVPVKGIFNKFSRVVRDIAAKQGKKIDFILEGEETEVDKNVGGMLSDPLIHLIRNSCDHGIETTADRLAAGKPENGRLILKASHKGTDLIIEIIDDGQGINRDKILEKARAKGIDVDENDDNAVLGLIFVAGISSKEKATDLSGRGVGMDVVKTCIEALNGDLNITSIPGKGTHLTMMIPMMMGVNTLLLVESAGGIYALPFEQVQEVIKIDPIEIRMSFDNYFFHYRGHVIKVNLLQKLLNGKDGNGLPRHREIPVVIIRSGQKVQGVVVDKFIRNLGASVKPLPASLTANEICNGVCVMGNGQLVLVLNPERLF